MARYDRIARLDPPSRARAFPGWAALADLEGRERDGEAGRRARLRFLVLRPVLRMVARGVDGLDPGSFNQQLEGARAELGHLHRADPERGRLADFLDALANGSQEAVARATTSLARSFEQAGHGHAAEEYYLTAMELAEAHGLGAARLSALRGLEGLYATETRWHGALELLDAVLDNAESAGDGEAWGAAMAAAARVRWRAGATEEARALIDRVAARARTDGGDPGLGVLAATALCDFELAGGRPDAALEAGWRALELGPRDRGERHRVLLSLAAAFRQVGLPDAADACYRMVSDDAPDPTVQTEAQVERAVLAAENGDADLFRARRLAVLEEFDQTEPFGAAVMHAGLGRGAMLVGDLDDARDHARAAVTGARAAGGAGAGKAEALLTSIERATEHAMAAETLNPSASARAIARRIESLERTPVSAG
jgi:tetratricopeptide (TPR) repeat protein